MAANLPPSMVAEPAPRTISIANAYGLWEPELMKTALLTLALLSAACASSSMAKSPPETATGILARMKSACGGAAWDRVKGWHETGTVDLPGRPGVPYEIWHDMASLKTTMQNRVGDRVLRHAGYDGSSYWQAGPDGKLEIGRDPLKLRKQRRDAYLSSAGWFFPRRFPAKIDLGESQAWEGKLLPILRIAPQGAEPFELWVDPDTHQIRRIIAGAEYANLSDYRMFGGICSATSGRQGDGDPTHEVVLHVERVETEKAIPASTFAPPSGK
jgi:hypothetical protein